MSRSDFLPLYALLTAKTFVTSDSESSIIRHHSPSVRGYGMAERTVKFQVIGYIESNVKAVIRFWYLIFR